MRGIFLSVLMIVSWGVGVSQNLHEWSEFIKGSVQAESAKKSGIFMVETSRSELVQTESLRILKSFDANHYIVEGVIDTSDKAWEVSPDWKLNISNRTSETFYVVTSDAFDPRLLSTFKLLRSYGSINTYVIKGDLKRIKDKLLPYSEVIHITDKIARPEQESRVIDLNLNPNRVNKIHHFYPLINGSTETISIQENRFRENDIDLLNRNVPSGLESEISDNHATEMATIIAGKGNSFITGRGVARDARISSSDFFDVLPDPDDSYTDLGILTQNHSYGVVDDSSHYGVEARAFDISAANNTSLLHIFSSGNQGTAVSNGGNYIGLEGFSNLTGNIKMSKNSLVVGSVDTVGNVPVFVSRGPTYDGRVKPEVVAYSVVGSSNSAALVSGVASLLQQQYRIDQAADMPSALAKALLINSADDVGETGPDFITGFGNINAWRSLEALRNDQYFEGAVSDGNVESFVLNVPNNAVNLKVTLVWTDPAANVDDFTALINNLDLRLVDGSGSTLPWVLNTSASTSALSQPATRGIDNMNNAEQITIANPQTSYAIEVAGTVVSGSQDFYIAWQYDIEDSFEWDYPTGSDNMPYNGETGSYFRWTTTKSGVGELAYTEDEINWITLDSNVDLSDERWRWNNPPLISNAVKARMVIGAETFETEFFTVSEPLSASVGFNCADSLMLRWDPSPNAIDYTIYNLGEEELEMYATVSDTFLVIPDTSAFPNRMFSIQPNLPDNMSLLAAPTFDYSVQGIGCYVFSFFQTVVLDTGIYLNLTLGTTYEMEEIVFERSEFDSFVTIETITNLDSEEIRFLDSNPNQGYNEHRAIIRFSNGEELILSTGSAFYLTEIPVRVFPNPAVAGENITVITRDFEDASPLLELIDGKGALVHKQEVIGTLDNIPTGGLQPGMYFYRLFADGDVYTGRLLVR